MTMQTYFKGDNKWQETDREVQNVLHKQKERIAILRVSALSTERSFMEGIKVYKMNDYEWWASKLSIEETAKFIENEIRRENDLDDVKECDLDKDGMRWPTEDRADLDRLGDADEIIGFEIINGQTKRKVGFGDLMRSEGKVYKYIPLRLALLKSGEYTEPFCIAATEW